MFLNRRRPVKSFAIFFGATSVVAMVAIQAVAHLPVTRPGALVAAQPVLYFAYGSNMPVRYLSNVRRVDVFDSSPGELTDHSIQFQATSLDYFEPAVAHLTPDPGESAYGVLHEISAESIKLIICSEGSSYRMVQRPVKQLNSQKLLTAWTLVSRPSVNTAVPSQRYLDLMLEGVREFPSLAKYEQRLAKMDGVYWPVLSELIETAIYAMILFKSATADYSCSEELLNG